MTILPQQRLMLELLVMSGDIGITSPPDQGVLWRTLGECRDRGWLTLREVSPRVWSASITRAGRSVVQDVSSR